MTRYKITNPRVDVVLDLPSRVEFTPNIVVGPLRTTIETLWIVAVGSHVRREHHGHQLPDVIILTDSFCSDLFETNAPLRFRRSVDTQQCLIVLYDSGSHTNAWCAPPSQWPTWSLCIIS